MTIGDTFVHSVSFCLLFFLFVDYMRKVRFIAIRSAGKREKYERVKEKERENVRENERKQ